MKAIVSVGTYDIEEIEGEDEETLTEQAWELAKEWLAENYYWTEIYEEEEN